MLRLPDVSTLVVETRPWGVVHDLEAPRLQSLPFGGAPAGVFMCYERVLIEACTFFLAYPLLSVSVTVSAILIFSSLGSFLAGHGLRRGGTDRVLLSSRFVLAALSG